MSTTAAASCIRATTHGPLTTDTSGRLPETYIEFAVCEQWPKQRVLELFDQTQCVETGITFWRTYIVLVGRVKCNFDFGLVSKAFVSIFWDRTSKEKRNYNFLVHLTAVKALFFSDTKQSIVIVEKRYIILLQVRITVCTYYTSHLWLRRHNLLVQIRQLRYSY